MGIAVLEKGKLLYHGVETLQGKRGPHERLRIARKTVLRLIRDFRPKIVAYEKTFFGRGRNTALLNVLADEIPAIALRKGLKVLGFAPSTVKKQVCGNGQASKVQVARAVTRRFPSLNVYLTQDRKWKERYHSNRFDAVAVGLTANTYGE